MAELIANCPRCGAKQITFDLLSQSPLPKQLHCENEVEAFCACRACHRSTVFVLRLLKLIPGNWKHLPSFDYVVNSEVEIMGYVNARDLVGVTPPDHVPLEIRNVFREGAACLAAGCNNAAVTMFRLCVDMVTKSMLPEGTENGLNRSVRRILGHRLPWLFKNKMLPDGLRDLSSCIKEDGNDGAHDGTLTAADAEDLLDFTRVLLERIYTEPKRLELAKERRAKRRKERSVKEVGDSGEDSRP